MLEYKRNDIIQELLMKYKINFLPEAEQEKFKLDNVYIAELKYAYDLIEKDGIEFVRINSLGNKLFEVKTEKTRSIYKYQAGQLIIIGVIFLKKSQKTPPKYLKLAQKRFKEYEND
jgi:phage-related protein